MKVCIFGAGAVGSHLAAKLLRARAAEVALVARGAHLAAIRSRGLSFRGDKETFTVDVPLATDEPADLPPQDLVLVTLKAVSQPGSAAAIGRLVGPGGAAMFLANGIGWWWRYGIEPRPETLPLLDPEGRLWSQVRPDRTLAGVIYSPNEITEPGVVSHHGPSRFVLGSPENRVTPALEAARAILLAGGFAAEVSTDIRREVWLKLLLNAPGNPLAALTRLTAAERASDPGLSAVAASIVREVLAVARAMGWDLAADVDVEAIVHPPAPMGAGRPSMLQDILAGRPTEADALLGQVAAFGSAHGVATPVIDVVLPLVRGLDRAARR